MKSRSIVITVVALMLLSVLILLSFSINLKPRQDASSPLLGKPAPAITGNDILSPELISLKSLEHNSEFVLVNFFASWCQPCQYEEPLLVNFSKTHPQIAILAIAFNDSVKSAETFLKYYGAHFFAINDSSGAIAISYGVSSPPESFLVSKANIVLARFLGPITSAELTRAIQTFS